MTDPVRTTPVDEDARIAEIVDLVVAIASYNFDRRATVGDGSHLLDGLATGLNMLSEELERRHTRESAHRERLLQNERLLAVGQLAAGVAHEINNPSSFVLANLRELEQDLRRMAALASDRSPAAAAEQAALVARARDMTRDNISGVERIVAIVRDLRTFTRLEVEKLELVDMADVVADAARFVHAEVGYRARLVLDVAAETVVHGDRTKLTQVFTNLLINAAQAIPEGARAQHEIAVVSRVTDGHVAIEVRDTGAGLSPEAQARLFEPFFTTKPRDKGTGLGLALSAEIVRHHGGTLKLLRTSPQGTSFEVSLPLDASSAAALTVADRRAPVARARVLIIDDEPMLLSAYKRLLDRDYDVSIAAGGQAAIDLIAREQEWDAVFCDVVMPDVDGIAVQAWIAEHHPALLDHVIFCTGGAFTPRTSAFVERVADRLLQKPVSPDDLRAAVERVRSRR